MAPVTDGPTYHVGVTPLPYTVERDPGLATVTPSMTDEATLRIRAPSDATAADIGAALDDRRAWVLDALYGLTERRDRLPVRSFESGDRLLYGGRRRPLRVAESPVDEPQLQFDGGRFALRVPREGETDAAARSRTVRDWYVDHARDALSACAARVADDAVPRLRVDALDRRWVRVDDGRITLHWRLVLAPRPVAAYAVAHALVRRDHEPTDDAFWTAVEALAPAARSRSTWLRLNGARLRI